MRRRRLESRRVAPAAQGGGDPGPQRATAAAATQGRIEELDTAARDPARGARWPRRRAAASGDARRRRWATACVEKMKFGIDSIIVALFVFFLFFSMILGLKLKLCE